MKKIGRLGFMIISIIVASSTFAENQANESVTNQSNNQTTVTNPGVTRKPSKNTADKMIKKNGIESKTATGNSQTTIVDENGNLKVVEPSHPQQTPKGNKQLNNNASGSNTEPMTAPNTINPTITTPTTQAPTTQTVPNPPVTQTTP